MDDVVLGLEGHGNVDMSRISLDEIGLVIAEDIVQRMSRHWQQQQQQPQPEDATTPSGPEAEAGTGSAAEAEAEAEAGVVAGSRGDPDAFTAATTAPALGGGAAAAPANAAPNPEADAGAGGMNGDWAAAGDLGARRGRGLLQNGAGTSGNAMYANAFRLVFGNFFDFVEGARRFIATLAAEAELLLINVDWIRDLAFLATAPLDNVINSNWLPLPRSIDQLRTLLQTAINDYCTPESVVPSQLRLGTFTGPTFALELSPASCPVKVDMKTGRRSIDWDKCKPAQLVITITPATYIGKYYTAPVYTGKSCKYSRGFGTDQSYSVGGGTNSYTFRRSARQLDITPVLNQFFLRGQFSPFVADNLRFGNVTGGPIVEVTSTSGPTTANGSNAAFVFRSPQEAAASEAYLQNRLIAVQDDAPVPYIPDAERPAAAEKGEGKEKGGGGGGGGGAAAGRGAAAGPAAEAATEAAAAIAGRGGDGLAGWGSPQRQPPPLQRQPQQPPPQASPPTAPSEPVVGQADAAVDTAVESVVPYNAAGPPTGPYMQTPPPQAAIPLGPLPPYAAEGGTAEVWTSAAAPGGRGANTTDDPQVPARLPTDPAAAAAEPVALYSVQAGHAAAASRPPEKERLTLAAAAPAADWTSPGQPGPRAWAQSAGSAAGGGSSGAGGPAGSARAAAAAAASLPTQERDQEGAGVGDPAAPWELSYTERLLDVVDRAFGSGGYR
ncbi:hypothetical protein PLESTB_001703400 [Pleodorina starrii]|uniref:Uncharacterized protein n=1 Tax=Pleodorina starrii TaxID=330485 RepID=A0A9W6F9R5_9CHLO|nr:hypothetical protein PLESTB_001703400 [Pleodorina starrii]GLC66248.1 hypothetical protein PLESTF_000403500 [Pleodorina starrii]